MNGFDPARIGILTGGSGLLVGCVTDDGEPLAVRAWSAAVTGPGRIRVAMSADDPRVVACVRDRSVAVTAADVRTLDSVQVKGTVVAVGPPSTADLDLADLQSLAFFTAIHETDGDPVERLRKLLPARILMLDIEVGEVYDQTPGPRAGAPIGAAP